MTLATPNEILDDIRACTTDDEITASAIRHKAALAAIREDPAQDVREIHIKNLAAFKRREFAKGI